MSSRGAEYRFRWFLFGNIRGITRLRNIIQVCPATPEVCHWLTTRELDTVRKVTKMMSLPENLVLRASGAIVDGPAPKDFTFTSTVVTDPEEATCPSSLDGGNCGVHICKGVLDGRNGQVPEALISEALSFGRRREPCGPAGGR